MLIAGPAFLPRQIIHLHEKQLRDIRREQPLVVVGEHRRVEAAFVQFPIQKPKPQEIVAQLFAEQPLTAHRIERHQYPALEQLLRWNRWPSFVGIQLIKQGRKPHQDFIHPCFDPAQRMLGGHTLVQVDGRQKLRLSLRFSTHDSLTDQLNRHSNFVRVFHQTARSHSSYSPHTCPRR